MRNGQSSPSSRTGSVRQGISIPVESHNLPQPRPGSRQREDVPTTTTGGVNEYAGMGVVGTAQGR